MKRLILLLLVTLSFSTPAVAADHWDMVSGGLWYTHAIKSDGTLWGWGYNAYGQVGDGTAGTDRLSPVQIGIDRTWVWVGHGFNCSFAIKANGTLWAWGLNNGGQLGDGTTTERHYPVQIGVATTWVSVSAGWNHAIGIRSDGTIWGWGWNNYGEVGDGTNTQRLTPVQIGSDTNWAEVSAGGWHSLARKTTGTIWAWGRNYVVDEGHTNQGMIGDNTNTNRNAPVDVSNAKTWTKIAASYVMSAGITNDGKLWSWGGGHLGELGLGDTDARLVPTQIGTATTWTAIAPKNDTAHALRSDGTLWAWGDNFYGQLGDGTDVSDPSKLTPFQIGALTTWASVSRAYYHAVALKTGGSLWVWGRNDHGQLGDGTTTERTSPVEIAAPARTYVVAPSGGDYTTIQSCVNVAVAGETCLVYPGTYAEKASTAANGTAGSPVTIRAYGSVTTQGFTINHAYTTIEGFTFAGATGTASVYVGSGGNYCELVNNNFSTTSGSTTYALVMALEGPTGCAVRGNTFNDLVYLHVMTGGSGHLFEYNDMRALAYEDYVRPWGTNITFRRNRMWSGLTKVSGHADITQIYWQSGGSNNITFEENWIADQPIGSLGQYNIYGGTVDGVMHEDVGDYTFTRNVFANIAGNWSFGIPSSTLSNNMFYRAPLTGSTMSFSVDMKGNDVHDTTFLNNVFLGLGNSASTLNSETGWYSYSTAFGVEAIDLHVTLDGVCAGCDCTSSPRCDACIASDACLIQADLITNGYMTSGPTITAAACALASESEMTFAESLAAYKTDTFNLIDETCTRQQAVYDTFVADYNYVAGSPGAGYLAKKTSACSGSPLGVLTRYNFCEAHGINGVDPELSAGNALSAGILKVEPFSSATWVASTKTLTKTGAFTSYTHLSGDQIFITSSSPTSRAGIYTVASRTDANNIVLDTLVSGQGISDDRTANVSGFAIVPQATMLGADGIPFTLDDGLRPATGSPLCTGGQSGGPIGPYSCTSNVVFAGGSALPPAATALSVPTNAIPMLQWTQTGSSVVEFLLLVDTTTPYWLGLPTPSGTTYQARLPNLTVGSHTLTIMGCNTGGCTASASIQVVKM